MGNRGTVRYFADHRAMIAFRDPAGDDFAIAAADRRQNFERDGRGDVGVALQHSVCSCTMNASSTSCSSFLAEALWSVPFDFGRQPNRDG